MRVNYKNPYVVSGTLVGLIALWLLIGKLFNENLSVGGSNERGGERLPISILNSSAEKIKHTIQSNARIKPAKEVDLHTKISAEVVEILANKGDKLKQSVPIVKLKDAYYKKALSGALNKLQSAQLEYESKHKLYKQKLSSANELYEAEAALNSAQANLEKARTEYEYTTIKAPFDGIVNDILVEEGQKVSAESREVVAHFVDISNLKAVANLSIDKAKLLKIGGEAKLNYDHDILGKVTKVSKVEDGSTYTYEIEVTLPNIGESVYPGELADIEFTMGDRITAHTLPYSALVLDSSGILGVHTVLRNGKVCFKKVKLVKRDANSVWVSGLNEQEKIVTLGSNYLADGQYIDNLENYLIEP